MIERPPSDNLHKFKQRGRPRGRSATPAHLSAAAVSAHRVDALFFRLADTLAAIIPTDDDPRAATIAGAVDVVLELRRGYRADCLERGIALKD